MNRVVVFFDDQQKLTNFYECNNFSIFEKTTDGYENRISVQFDRIIPKGPAQIRKDVNALIAMITDCDIAAFGDISGIPYSAFDMAGYSIFQIPEWNNSVLDDIFSDIEQFEIEKSQKNDMIKNARPIPMDTEGYYIFDLLKVQEANPEISSKKALSEFFDTTPFMELKLLCAHIPPWIEKDQRFQVASEKVPKGYVALITHRQC